MFLKAIALTAFAVIAFCSCTKMVIEEEDDDFRKVYTAELVFDGDLTTFDASTRTSSTSWEDGSKVYLQFKNGSNYVNGIAEYDASISKWTVEFYGEIVSKNEQICEALFFENVVEYGENVITLDETSIVYRDTKGTYYFDGHVLTVSAHLTPQTGRIRFEGEPGYEYTVTGFSRLSHYNIAENSLTSEAVPFSDYIPESGKSDYYYVFFDNSLNSARRLQFYDRENNVRYEKSFPQSVLANGKSGFMNIPTISNHNSWGTDPLVRTFTVNGVSFNMILVDCGHIKGRYNIELYDYYDYNISTSKDYYIGETEITEALYQAITGETVKGLGDNYPYRGLPDSDPDRLYDCDNLYQITGYLFRMPLREEWQFAAMGGLLSCGYCYSGSNNIDQVAWYNCDEPHEVKQKLPNELGLYDMTGNCYELSIYEWLRYGNGYRAFRADYYCGGNFSSVSEDCYNHSLGYDPGEDGVSVGARLCVDASEFTKY